MSILSDLRRTIKYPTSIIIRGGEVLGVDLAKSLLEQGGYVIIVDHITEYTQTLVSELTEYELFSFYDFTQLPKIEDFLRRLDYVFFLNHKIEDLDHELSSQEFLEFSKFLDQVLSLANKFEAKFLATTSIKAHQHTVSKKEMEVGYNLGSEIHTVYKESEFQRYVESLTFEYIQKSSLDARIVRIGEMIGEGIHFTIDTQLGKLVKESIVEDALVIHGDGLSADYYVHILDAVYGLIKAQFAKNTRGEIFSLAYEYEVSLLSIAYKLNEFLPVPKEIIFSEDGNESDINIRLYKPAPNLMRVGWKPRITFERALKQTFEYASKIISPEEEEEFQLQDENVAPIKKRKSIKDTINWIFFAQPKENLAVDSENSESYTDEYGPLGRLITERKLQEDGRRGSILLANRNLQYRQKKNEENSFKDSFLNVFISKFDGITKKFDALRYITIRQFSSFVAIFLVLVIVYVNFFSVGISFFRNLFNIYLITEDINLQISNNEYDKLPEEFSELIREVEMGKEKLAKLDRYMKTIPVFTEFKSDYDKMYSGLSFLNEGMSDMVNGGEGVEEYLSEFDPKVLYRANSVSLLTLENVGNYSSSVKKISSQIDIVDDGLVKLKRGQTDLTGINIEKYGYEYEQFVNNFLNNIERTGAKFSIYGNAGKVIPDFVGLNSEKNYYFILVDNTRYLPAGGVPTSVVNVKFSNGGISKIESKILNENQYSLNLTDNLLIEQINLVDANFIDNQTGRLRDIFYLQQGDLYLDEITRLISTDTKETVDGVVIMNINFVRSLLELVGSVEYEQINFDQNNLFVNLDLLAENNRGDIEYQKELYTNLFSILLQSTFNNLDEKFIELMQIISKGAEKKDLVYKLYNTSLNTKFEHSDSLIKIVPDYVNVLAVSDSDNYEGFYLPIINTEIDILVRDDFTTRKTVSITYDGIKNLEAIVVCLPPQVSNFTFKEDDNLEKVERFSELQTCIRFKENNEKEVSFSFDNISVNSVIDNGFDFKFGLRKQPGIDMNYDIEVTTSNKTIKEYTEGGNFESNKISYVGQLQSDKIIGVSLNE